MRSGADWQSLIDKAIENEASDIHMTVGQRPHMRCRGVLSAMDADLLTESFMSDFCAAILNESQQERLARDRDIDLSWIYAERRFRVNAYRQQGFPALAIRLLPERIPSLAELGAPGAWQKLKEVDHGLILVTGRTGSGKTTTLAAFIDELNREKAYHIVTLEDPIEYVFEPQKCFFSQRELGRDFVEFSQALRGALREVPDVILVGEIRDAQTMRTAIMAAETGILVLASLHTPSAEETALRVEGLFPLSEQEVVRAQFADVLTGIVSQSLLPRVGGGRVNASEVLLRDPAVRNIIKQGKYAQLSAVMLSHQQEGMQTKDRALDNLFQSGYIDREIWQRYHS
ncbi:MAG: PilT/PilU family type 4a pilus ATPase [Selenomonas sp.]|nr:PilT/PilU family type 4a pilus ATPase [Selenomonas sp.]